jgi:hemolysin III
MVSVRCPPKPRLRGVSHQFAAVAAAGAGAVLLTLATTPTAVAATAVYVVTLAVMFGVSAVYHRVDWSPAAEARLRRLDHAAIFLVIAGTYTPLAVLAIGGDVGRRLLALAWAGAALGVVRATLWTRAPRTLAALLYVALGWVAVGYVAELRAGVGLAGVILLAAGGILYTVGALVYALRRPDPRPAVFGYHEVFHALTIAAGACHFAVVLRCLRVLR